MSNYPILACTAGSVFRERVIRLRYYSSVEEIDQSYMPWILATFVYQGM